MKEQGDVPKLQNRYMGPYLIMKVISKYCCIVKNLHTNTVILKPVNKSRLKRGRLYEIPTNTILGADEIPELVDK